MKYLKTIHELYNVKNFLDNWEGRDIPKGLNEDHKQVEEKFENDYETVLKKIENILNKFDIKYEKKESKNNHRNACTLIIENLEHNIHIQIDNNNIDIGNDTVNVSISRSEPHVFFISIDSYNEFLSNFKGEISSYVLKKINK